MNTRNISKMLDENPHVETLVVVGAALFALVGAALLFPLFLVWVAAISLLVKFKKTGGSDEQRVE